MREEIKYCFRQEAAQTGNIHKLYVYDSVRAKGDFNWETWEREQSETSAKYFRDRLDEIPDGETIELHVNSAGGEVGEGVAIFNLLKQKRDAGSTIIGYVDGMAYSVAMDIIMAATEIHMGLGTTMFLHNPWMFAAGNAEQLRNYADQLDAMAIASQQLYLSRSGGKISQDELAEMMAMETMLDPETCMKYGFCDVIDDFEGSDPEPEDPAAALQELRNELFRQQEINRMLQNLKGIPEGLPADLITAGILPKDPGEPEKNVRNTFLEAIKRTMEEKK